MSSISKNPFAMLDEDGEDAPAPAPVPVAKPAAAPAKKSDARPSSAAPKDGGRAPKREYDRKSGTGRGRASDGQEDKRGGAGKGNWGRLEDGTRPRDIENDAEMTEEEKAAAEAAALEKKKEEEQMSLEEYLSKKEKDDLAAKPGREAEKIDMKGLKVAEKEDDDAFGELGGEGGAKNKGKKSSGRKATAVTDLGFGTKPRETSTYDRRPGGRGDRRDNRGERRPPRGAGGGRGGGNAANIDIADASAFPSL